MIVIVGSCVCEQEKDDPREGQSSVGRRRRVVSGSVDLDQRRDIHKYIQAIIITVHASTGARIGEPPMPPNDLQESETLYFWSNSSLRMQQAHYGYERSSSSPTLDTRLHNNNEGWPPASNGSSVVVSISVTRFVSTLALFKSENCLLDRPAVLMPAVLFCPGLSGQQCSGRSQLESGTSLVKSKKVRRSTSTKSHQCQTQLQARNAML